MRTLHFLASNTGWVSEHSGASWPSALEAFTAIAVLTRMCVAAGKASEKQRQQGCLCSLM